MTDDSILKDLRTVREQHTANLGYDLERIFADLKARQNQHAAEGWIVISPTLVSPPTTSADLHSVRFFNIS